MRSSHRFRPVTNPRLVLAIAVIGLALAAGAAEASSGTRAYWVFFRDRGDLVLDEAALVSRARALPAETWARRWRAGSPLPDGADLPLWQPYVAQVAACAQLRHQSRWLNAVSADIAPGDLPAIQDLPCVAGIRPVAIATLGSIGPGVDDEGLPLGTVLDAERISARDQREPLAYGASLGQLTEIGVPAVHALGYTGNRVRFMMIDTGFRKDHDALASLQRIGERDFVFGDGQTQNEPEDDPGQHDHGTATWSAAGGFAPGILIGPAFGASFVLAKTEDIRSETRVEEDHYVAALEWADSLGIAVTSASLCYVCFDSGFCYEFPDKDGDTAVITVAVDIAAARGILCVNAQGNYGCDVGSLGTPADADSMVAVGAVDSLNVIAPWSACGPTYDGRTKPEVVARGRRVWAASSSEPNAYGPASGTSLSCPLVSGAAALLVEAHPEWGPMVVRAALLTTADRAAAPDNTYGWGRINVEAALAYSPLIYPYPFSLIAPADSVVVSTLRPVFSWHASADPSGGIPLAYLLCVAEVGNPAQSWEVPAGGDTVLALPFALEPATAYTWEVWASTHSGLGRTSRETRVLMTPSGSSVEDPLVTADGGGGLRLTLGTNPVRQRLRFSVENQGGAEDELRWCLVDPLGRAVMPEARARLDQAVDVDLAALAGEPLPRGVYYLKARAGWRVARETLVVLGP